MHALLRGHIPDLDRSVTPPGDERNKKHMSTKQGQKSEWRHKTSAEVAVEVAMAVPAAVVVVVGANGGGEVITYSTIKG